jgi:hypothetical protein
MIEHMQTTDECPTLIHGAVPSGLDDAMVSGMRSKVHAAFDRGGMSVLLQGMRFIPSTKVVHEDGSFEVLAHTIVEVPGQVGISKRRVSFEAVVTVDTDANDTGRSLGSVRFPELEIRQRLAEDALAD